MSKIFLDGYNILNSWPNLVNIKEHSLEDARIKLVDLMQNYAHYKDEEVYIVFDAHNLKANMGNKEIRSKKVEVVFTKEGETADTYIERMADELGKDYEVVVVTSDLLEQQLAFQRGAIRKSSREFYEEVEEINRLIRDDLFKIKRKTGKNVMEDKLDNDIILFLDKMRKRDI